MRNVVCKPTILAAIGIAVSFTPGMLEASDHHVGPQELFLGEPTQVQKQYDLQLTSGLRWRYPDGEAASPSVPLVVELRLTERLQVELESAVGFSQGLAQPESALLEAGLLFAVRIEGRFRISAGLNGGV